MTEAARARSRWVSQAVSTQPDKRSAPCSKERRERFGTSCWCTAGSWTAPAGRASIGRCGGRASTSAWSRTPPRRWPTTSAATRWVLDGLDGPAILVGHSYGGAVISEAGNAPNVAGLVYIAAFAPDAGESVATLIKDPAPGAPVPPILPPRDGFLLLDRSKFAASFAADVEPDLAAFMADAQVPWGMAALEGAVSQPAWKTTAELVSGDHRGSHDPACRPARDGRARRRHRRRSGCKPLGVRLAARGGGPCHRHGCRRGPPCGCVNVKPPPRVAISRRRFACPSRDLSAAVRLPLIRGACPRHLQVSLRLPPPASRHRRS